MNFQILVDSHDFWASLKADILSAQDQVYIQTLSFEGDRVGQNLAEALLASAARDKKLMIDSYTKYKISDQFLYSLPNLLKSELQQEARETWQIIKRLNQNGVGVKFINPVGLFFSKFADRNHKKMIVIDRRILYIGGINFSQHNFAWHDMMLRIEDPKIAEFLTTDFLASWQGEHQHKFQNFGNIELYLFNGRNNSQLFPRFFDLIESARESIIIETPYLSFPFYDRLRTARKNGVKISFITSAANNWGVYDHYTRWETGRSGIDLYLYPDGMTHLKSMLIDDQYLIIGSSNFDLFSYYFQQDIIAICHDRYLIQEFKRLIFLPDLQKSSRWTGKISDWQGKWGYFQLKAACQLFLWVNR